MEIVYYMQKGSCLGEAIWCFFLLNTMETFDPQRPSQFYPGA